MADLVPDPGNSRLIAAKAVGRRMVTDVYYPGGMRQQRHRHNTATFSFVSSGRYGERIGRQSHVRNAATLIFHPAGEWHSVEFETDVRIVGVDFRGSEPDEVLNALDRGSSHSSDLIAWLGSRLEREIARSDDASHLAVDSLISELLADGMRSRADTQEKGSPAWLARARDHVHENFNSSIELADIADAAGVHSAHLSRVFRQKMGCTIGEYVRRLRFEYACRRIFSTRVPLCEIAYEAGFADQSHLNRIFRGKMGITPFAYRKLHRDARFVQDF